MVVKSKKNFDKALEDLEDIRRYHNKGKKLFVSELNKCESVEDLKRIIKNHLIIFFDEMNFMYSLSGKTLKLIRHVNKTNKRSSIHNEEFTNGNVQKDMQSIINEVQKFKKERLKQKQSK
jgi:hypothetical protein